MITILRLSDELVIIFKPFSLSVIQMKVQNEESEEMAKFKELFPDMKSPDSLYEKSPVSKTYCPRSSKRQAVTNILRHTLNKRMKTKTLSPEDEISHWKDKNEVKTNIFGLLSLLYGCNVFP